MSKKIVKPNIQPYSTNSELKDAVVILEACYDSVNSFYLQYQSLRKQKKGMSTDVEQDLLRAMLLFSASGLDAVIKQLINDSLEKVISKQEGASAMFSKFVERRIKKSEVIDDESKVRINLDSKYVAEVLIDENPRSKLLEDMQKDLTKESLQSFNQVVNAGKYFDIDSSIFDETSIRAAFDARKEITHEMDVDINRTGRKRRARAVKNMVTYTNTLLNVAGNFINAVYSKLVT